MSVTILWAWTNLSLVTVDAWYHTLMHGIIHYMVQYQYDAMHQQGFRQQSRDTMHAICYESYYGCVYQHLMVFLFMTQCYGTYYGKNQIYFIFDKIISIDVVWFFFFYDTRILVGLGCARPIHIITSIMVLFMIYDKCSNVLRPGS